MTRQLYCIGHRGARGHEPENTLRSIEAAIALGAPAIEVDVHLLQGRHLVIIHGRRLEDTTNGVGDLARLTFDELRGLDAGKGERIPTLEEVIECVAERAELNVEIKGADTVPAVVALIKRYSGSNASKRGQFLLSSFDHCQLVEARALAPDIRRAPLISGVPIGYAAFAAPLDAYSVHINLEFVRAAFIADAHARGLKVFVFTVNHPEEIEEMREMDVDGVFTDYPERVLRR